MSLVEETKKAIGFVQVAGTCANCKHQIEGDHPMVERQFVRLCTLSSICEFEVKANSTCRKFERRTA